MKYVIIGNSAAGIGAVEGIRHVDKKGGITIITNEPHHTYSRPLISYLLLGKVTREGIKYRGDSFYKDNNCTLLANMAVTKINTAEKNVVYRTAKSSPTINCWSPRVPPPLCPPLRDLIP